MKFEVAHPVNARLLKFATLLCLSLLVAACSEDKALPAKASAETAAPAAAESLNKSPEPPEPAAAEQSTAAPDPFPAPGKPEQPASSPPAVPAPASSEEVQPLQNYMDAVHGDRKGDLIFSAKQDLDLDGYDEIVLGYGDLDEAEPQYSVVSELYVLRDMDGEVVELAHDPGGGYQKLGFKLIRLQDLPQTFIYCGLTNGGGMSGFEVQEVSGNQVLDKVYSASPTGTGEDEILDTNNDGQLDTYMQYRNDYNTFNYALNRTYEMESGEFVLQATKVEIPEYPQEIKEVILQYLSLTVLEVEQSPETEERLARLWTGSAGTAAAAEDLGGWREALEGYHSEIRFDIKEKGPEAEASLSYTDGNKQKEEHAMQLHLVKGAAGWQIDGLELIPGQGSVQ
ncbi:hypothetical protein [Paenibacillus sp. MMS20-IR301]|uniref:hypothetical protein n=1 Tax=Paenibacillus sp. MMS20-IR301 TaxID=2895946 RepID=UPI0028E6E045|nr:hypothetical protein [Paenibacillus sp. MMS20-IR301]WNS43686.1 hypothetical protein LOS79_32995 [Paenibacillus sp. MMS20-IR301]